MVIVRKRNPLVGAVLRTIGFEVKPGYVHIDCRAKTFHVRHTEKEINRVAHDPRLTEAILHELCHFIVATDAERAMYNCGIGDSGGFRCDQREHQACSLEVMLEDAADVELTSSDDDARELLRDTFERYCDNGRRRHLNAMHAHEALVRFDGQFPGASREIVAGIRESVRKWDRR